MTGQFDATRPVSRHHPPAESSTAIWVASSTAEWRRHVRPPRFPDDVTTTGNDPAHPDHSQSGFRVPTYIVSPFARRGVVAHTPLEHSAILKFVEWRYSLAPLTKRDDASYNLANLLDFRAPNRVPPTITVSLTRKRRRWPPASTPVSPRPRITGWSWPGCGPVEASRRCRRTRHPQSHAERRHGHGCCAPARPPLASRLCKRGETIHGSGNGSDRCRRRLRQ